MRLFLDDERFPPEDQEWCIARSYEQFTQLIREYGLPSFISFDHDLGEGKNGLDCANFLIDYCMDYNERLPDFYVHSQNPVGAQNIKKKLEAFQRWQCK